MAKQTRIKYLTEDQQKQLLSTLKKQRADHWRDYFMIRFMLNAGTRLSETTSLTVGDVMNGKGPREVVEIHGKGNRIRRQNLNKDIRDHINVYIRQKKRNKENISDDAPLFLSRNKRRITPRAVQMNFNKWVKESGLDGNYSPHCLRHSAGTRVQREFGDIRKTQAFLGHASITSTMVYTHVSEEDLKEVAERISI